MGKSLLPPPSYIKIQQTDIFTECLLCASTVLAMDKKHNEHTKYGPYPAGA